MGCTSRRAIDKAAHNDACSEAGTDETASLAGSEGACIASRRAGEASFALAGTGSRDPAGSATSAVALSGTADLRDGLRMKTVIAATMKQKTTRRPADIAETLNLLMFDALSLVV
jgi:hypothetical protein